MQKELEKELNQQKKDKSGGGRQIEELLKFEIDQMKKKLRQEKQFMERLMKTIYETWTNIKEHRSDNNNVVLTPVKLMIREY